MAENEDIYADKAHADIGIVCAMSIEIATFLNRCLSQKKYKEGRFVFRGGLYDGIRIAVAQSGLGFANARAATQALIDTHTPRWILSCGFSGGLIPELKIGHIVLANGIVDTHGQEMAVDLKMNENRKGGLFIGRYVVADEMVRTIEEKMQLAEKYNAIAVDMESLAVAQACREAKLPFMTVRAVSDDLSEDLPKEIHSVINSSGSARLGATVGALWKRPGSAKDMWHLRENALRAANSLADFLDGVVTQLYESAQ